MSCTASMLALVYQELLFLEMLFSFSYHQFTIRNWNSGRIFIQSGRMVKWLLKLPVQWVVCENNYEGYECPVLVIILTSSSQFNKLYDAVYWTRSSYTMIHTYLSVFILAIKGEISNATLLSLDGYHCTFWWLRVR